MDDFDHTIRLATAHHKALDLPQAVEAYRLAISLRPDVAAVHNNLGSALRLLGRVDEAIVSYLLALKLSPDAVQVWSNLGNAYKEAERIDEAIVAYRQAITADPNNAPAHNNLAAALEDTGDMAAAVKSYRRAAEIDTDSATIGSNLVYAMHFSPEFDSDDLLAAHRQWYNRHGRHLLPRPGGERVGVRGETSIDESRLAGELRPPLSDDVASAIVRNSTPHASPLTPALSPPGRGSRRLRIGYLSPDFRDHPVGRFMAPLLANHDRHAFEVFCYADVLRPDAITHRLRPHTEHWRQVVGMSDEQVSEQIRADRVDVLVDLTMHMARNRLGVFARRPAPVQVTYLAYCSTTGVETIDYRVTDPYLDAPHAKVNTLPYVERSLFLPESYWCYEPPEQAPEVSTTPAMASGHFTFGCFNNFCKAGPPALMAWAEIVRSVPGSRLLLHAKAGSHRDRVRNTFRDAGVDPERVEFVPSRPFADYLSGYGQLDLALDPFPYGGGTTTFDGLWMGVPVVTLRGRTAVGRSGVSILSNLKLKELIAESPEEYVRIAVREAGDLSRLNDRRLGMRQRLRSSICTNGPRWTRQLEAIYQQIAPR